MAAKSEGKPMLKEQTLPNEVKTVYQLWEQVQAQPQEWLTDIPGQIVFVAGGGLPLTFASEDSQIWAAIEKVASETGGRINIAGVNFSLRELSLMGDFYRFLKQDGYSLHCIDERLEDNLGNEAKQVHEHCGACAASHAVIGAHLDGENVEDLLLKELGEEILGKQRIYHSMPNHDPISIYVDFHGDEAVIDENKRSKLRNSHALAFQVSLPVNKLEAFLTERGNVAAEQEMLLGGLVKWNVQIARNIIGGGHNEMQRFANQTVTIFDQREVKNHPLVDSLKELISDVQHDREIVIE
ncbi:MAG: hypothetical protein ACOZAK_03005 [Patescibacteria group bacterium]